MSDKLPEEEKDGEIGKTRLAASQIDTKPERRLRAPKESSVLLLAARWSAGTERGERRPVEFRMTAIYHLRRMGK